jgi:hypothetical protein
MDETKRLAQALDPHQAELRAYQPTLRDRIASFFVGDERASPEKARLVEGLFGSRGLGNTGMGLVDMTPAGAPLWKQELDEAGSAGDAVLAAANFLPGAKGVAQGVKAAAGAADDAVRGIRAYHGSPHDFDKFDISKIGTGEGAQAYGHGLYFADSEDVAKSYRDAMTGKGLKIGAPAPDFPWSDEISAFAYRAASEDNVDAATAATRAAWRFPELRGRDLKPLEDTIAKAKDAYKGRMYEVRINADPEHFLDWDKPITQQPAGVEAATWKRLEEIVDQDTPILDDVFDKFTRGEATGANIAHLFGLHEKGTQALREAGIPGIRYLDQGSRGAGEGSSNYVVFDDALVEILKKYGLVGTAGPAMMANALLSSGAPPPDEIY